MNSARHSAIRLLQLMMVASVVLPAVLFVFASWLSYRHEQSVADAQTPDRVSVLTRMTYGANTYLYVGRYVDREIAAQTAQANSVLADYQAMMAKSRANQLKFNAALLLGALIIVGLAILTALRLADRMVRPVGELVFAAGRIEEHAASDRG